VTFQAGIFSKYSKTCFDNSFVFRVFLGVFDGTSKDFSIQIKSSSLFSSKYSGIV
jgi:hypothetical protein